ncbi:hypothetical protein INT82_14175 [Mannheimia haemolytica]|nr:hypothetical protein [Mannheimia haemolytica]
MMPKAKMWWWNWESYGNPSIESATDNLIKQGLSGLLCYRFIRNTVALLRFGV